MHTVNFFFSWLILLIITNEGMGERKQKKTSPLGGTILISPKSKNKKAVKHQKPNPNPNPNYDKQENNPFEFRIRLNSPSVTRPTRQIGQQEPEVVPFLEGTAWDKIKLDPEAIKSIEEAKGNSLKFLGGILKARIEIELSKFVDNEMKQSKLRCNDKSLFLIDLAKYLDEILNKEIPNFSFQKKFSKYALLMHDLEKGYLLTVPEDEEVKSKIKEAAKVYISNKMMETLVKNLGNSPCLEGVDSQAILKAHAKFDAPPVNPPLNPLSNPFTDPNLHPEKKAMLERDLRKRIFGINAFELIQINSSIEKINKKLEQLETLKNHVLGTRRELDSIIERQLQLQDEFRTLNKRKNEILSNAWKEYQLEKKRMEK